MKNYVDAKQFKADVHKYAQIHGIKGNEIGRLWQEIMLDDLLERISLSKYKNNFILKGGFLLSAIVGINKRSTEDIDTEITGLNLTLKQITVIFQEICDLLPLNDPLKIELTNVEKIHENEIYKGYRLHFLASFNTIRYPLKVDVSTGDTITPRAIKYKYKLHLENKEINIWAYTLETIVAEKLETIISRGIANTRMKDFYDLYVLQKEKFDIKVLQQAFYNTSKYRETVYYQNNAINFKYCLSRITLISQDQNMQKMWNRYVNHHPFAKGITFNQVTIATTEWLTKIKTK